MLALTPPSGRNIDEVNKWIQCHARMSFIEFKKYRQCQYLNKSPNFLWYFRNILLSLQPRRLRERAAPRQLKQASLLSACTVRANKYATTKMMKLRNATHNSLNMRGLIKLPPPIYNLSGLAVRHSKDATHSPLLHQALASCGRVLTFRRACSRSAKSKQASLCSRIIRKFEPSPRA